MFTIDTKIVDLEVKERSLYKVLFSMNIHQVATPELSAEDAKSYIFFFREGGRFQAYIGLYFPRTDRTLYYGHSANPFSETELSNIESEARSFAEDMGAMLDELDLSKMSDLEKDRWLDEQDIFSTRQTDEPTATTRFDQAPPGEQSAPVVQPAPTPPSAPVEPPVPSEKAMPVQSAPTPQSAMTVQPGTPPASAVQSIPEPTPASVAQPLAQESVQSPSSRPQGIQAATPRQPAAKTKTAPAAPDNTAPPVIEVSYQSPVKPGTLKAPKQPINKELGDSTIARRDKEALSRLLASF